MPLTTRVWGAGKVLFLCGALLLTYVLFAAASMRMALKTREVVVPELAGKTVNDASAALAEAGLTLKVEDGRKVDPKVPAGQILAQEPPTGARTRRQRSVQVWLSAGPRSTIVPALVGESERTAQLRVAQDGFGVGPTAEIRSIDYAAGTVVAQNPPAKSKSDSISLLVNRGERGATYVMPDLIGVNGDRAADLLRTRGFRVVGRRRSPLPGRAGRHRPAPEPAGRVPDRARRADLARGQPVSVQIAPSILSADFAALGAGSRGRRARRRRPDPRRRHGRPLRAEHHDRPAGRARRSQGRDGAARRAPDDRGPGLATSRRSSRPARRMISVHVEVLPHLHRTRAAHQAVWACRPAWRSTRRRPSPRSRRSPATSTSCS